MTLLPLSRVHPVAVPSAVGRRRPPCRVRAASLITLTLALLAPHAYSQDGAAPAAEPIALVKQVAGNAQLWRGDVPQPLQEGQSLVVSDRLRTGADGTVALVFRDGTRLTVGNASDVQLRRYAFAPKPEDYAFDIYLAKGRAVYASGRIGKLAPQSVRLETPTATAGVRGTRLILEVE